MSINTARILIVDDEPEVLDMIATFLEFKKGYTVFTATNGAMALEFLEKQDVDLVISDINMPVMKGFTLLSKIKAKYPSIRRILMTAYNVEEYFELALNYDVGTIFLKSIPFPFEELSHSITSILSADFFGAERFFVNPQSAEFFIHTAEQIDPTINLLIKSIPFGTLNARLILVLNELVANAIFYGALDNDPTQKMDWQFDFVLPTEKAIRLQLLWDETSYAITITDRGGKLTKRDVLYWLSRQTIRDDKGNPIGIGETHGRGLFLARRFIDRLIINIHPQQKTEIIILMKQGTSPQDNKPLFINEL